MRGPESLLAAKVPPPIARKPDISAPTSTLLTIASGEIAQLENSKPQYVNGIVLQPVSKAAVIEFGSQVPCSTKNPFGENFCESPLAASMKPSNLVDFNAIFLLSPPVVNDAPPINRTGFVMVNPPTVHQESAKPVSRIDFAMMDSPIVHQEEAKPSSKIDFSMIDSPDVHQEMAKPSSKIDFSMLDSPLQLQESPAFSCTPIPLANPFFSPPPTIGRSLHSSDTVQYQLARASPAESHVDAMKNDSPDQHISIHLTGGSVKRKSDCSLEETLAQSSTCVGYKGENIRGPALSLTKEAPPKPPRIRICSNYFNPEVS